MQYPTRFHRLARIITVSVVLALLGSGFEASAGPAPAYASSSLDNPFSPTSFWNAPLPASTPTDPRSDMWAAEIQDQIIDYFGNVAINTWQNSAPVWIAEPGAPTIAVKFNNCQNKSTVPTKLLEYLSAVPIPANAVAASGNDKDLVVWQPSTDQVWEMWKAEKRTDGWYACWGGRIQNASQSNGVFDGNYGVAATSLSLLGGHMRINELQAGEIDHALSLGLVRTRKSVYSWPANRTDGAIDDVNAIPEGQRFRLDPTLDVDSLNITPFAKMVARAMQKYGTVVSDKSGSVSIYGEDPVQMINAGQGNPYTSLFGGLSMSKVMNNFPWNRMQALPFDYGKNGVQEPGVPFAAGPSTVSTSGYRAVTASGSVVSFGDLADLGSVPTTSQVVGLTSTKSRKGYYVATASGGVHIFGDAVNYGSMSGKKLNAPMVGMATTPSGNGYYLLGQDGGVFAFGKAPFLGSTGSIKLNKPVVGMTTTPSGNGYWFVASDGGVFSYGDAQFYGSMGGTHLNKPVVGMAATPTGKGYWLVASDGGVFAFGDAPFYGSAGSLSLNSPIVGMSVTPDGGGYRFVASDGGVFNYGNAHFVGSLASTGTKSPVVALAN